MVFDLATIAAEEPEEIYDLPAGMMRLNQPATGVDFTIVNGEILLEKGIHSGALPGRVMRNSAYATATV